MGKIEIPLDIEGVRVIEAEYSGPIKSDKKSRVKRYNEGHEKTQRV